MTSGGHSIVRFETVNGNKEYKLEILDVVGMSEGLVKKCEWISVTYEAKKLSDIQRIHDDFGIIKQVDSILNPTHLDHFLFLVGRTPYTVSAPQNPIERFSISFPIEYFKVELLMKVLKRVGKGK